MGDPLNLVRRWSDEKLLRAASAGHEQAFAVFCERSLPSLYRYIEGHCWEFGIPLDLAKDICNDAALKALKQIQNGLKNPTACRPRVSSAWLHKIAYNQMLDWLKKNGRVKNTSDELELEAPEDTTVEDQEEMDQILEFFNWLNGRDRDILEYVLLSGMTIKAAGEKLGLRESNANRVYHKALDTLKALIRQHGSERITSGFDA